MGKMKIFTKLYADVFDLTADEVENLFGNIKPIKARLPKSCSIYPHKSCKVHVGQIYDKLTVVGFVGQNNWICKCFCGKTKVIGGNELLSGDARSCGCLRKELTKKKATTHGMSGSPEYYIWRSMLARCENPNNKAYKNYGGRGITVCEEWHKFSAFFKDMGKRPNKKRTLERKDNDLGYCPENCVWASWKVQANNKRKHTFHGSSIQRRFVAGHIRSRRIVRSNNQSAFARAHNLSANGISMCLYERLKQYKGWKFRWID